MQKKTQFPCIFFMSKSLFQVKLTLVVNLPAYMNITKAPRIILSDILISATVSTTYLPPSCGSGVWRFSRVAILGVCVFLCVSVC